MRHHDAEHTEAALRIAVYEMALHGRAGALDQVLARTVEMELHKLIRLAAGRERGAARHVDLDGVAIVDDVGDVGLVARCEVRQFGADRLDDVERRLARSGSADRKLLGDLAPLVRTVRTLVAPMRPGGGGLHGIGADRLWRQSRLPAFHHGCLPHSPTGPRPCAGLSTFLQPTGSRPGAVRSRAFVFRYDHLRWRRAKRSMVSRSLSASPHCPYYPHYPRHRF